MPVSSRLISFCSASNSRFPAGRLLLQQSDLFPANLSAMVIRPRWFNFPALIFTTWLLQPSSLWIFSTRQSQSEDPFLVFGFNHQVVRHHWLHGRFLFDAVVFGTRRAF